jgi:RNA polymerase sigma factor (sigma-70 family)
MLPNDSQKDAVFWHLWENNREIFFKKCLKIMGGDIDEAEDALSSAMLKARDKMLLNFGRIENFKGWALRLTENVCFDLLRRHRRLVHYGEIPEYFADNKIDDSFFLIECREKYRFQETALQEVFRLANRLPLRLREPFLLRFFLAEPYRCIADRLCISEENVRKRIQEARSVLKRQYGSKISRLLSSSLRERDMDPESPLVTKIRRNVREVLGDVEPEVDVPLTTAWIVNAPPETGGEKEVLFFLPLRGGRLENRAAALMQYVARHPGGWKKKLELAQIFLAAGLWDKAEKELRHVLEKHPRSFTGWLILGVMLAASCRREEAAGLFEEAGSLAKRASSKEFFSGMAALCRSSGGEALPFFEKASGLEPANISFRQAMGTCLFKSERYSEALDCFSEILAKRPEDVVSLAYCCEVSFVLNRLENAGEYIDAMLKGNPHDLFALKRRERLEDRRGDANGETRKKLRRLMGQFKRLQRMIEGAENENHSRTASGYSVPD